MDSSSLKRIVYIVGLGVMLFSLSVFSPSSILGATLKCVVTDHNGKPVSNAVISIFSQFDKPVEPTTINPPPTVEMVQKNRQFSPYVLPIQKGTYVKFPNKDKLKHHVYSFSSTKRFELKLYSGVPEKPVLFDQAGVVPLGCNIHDWMLAYIVVVDTPYFGKSHEKGFVVISDIPEGKYIARLWHPRLKKASSEHEKPLTLVSSETTKMKFNVQLKRWPRQKKAPAYDEEEIY